MKLLTHNFLTSKCLKGVLNGYPLKLVVHQKTDTTVEFNADFIKRLLPKMEYDALRQAALTAEYKLPEEKGDSDNEEFLKQLHHALLEIDIISGDLICPETGRIFKIQEGIPNMLCNETEVSGSGGEDSEKPISAND